MSYFRKRNGRSLSGISSQPPGMRVSTSALGQLLGVDPVVLDATGAPRQPAAWPQRAIRNMTVAQVPVVGMGGISSQPPGPRVSEAALGIFGDAPDGAAKLVDPIDDLRAKVADMLARQKAESDARKFALIIGAAGALFAAARLGIVAIPLIRKKRS
jgi:hypothetical protein